MDLEFHSLQELYNRIKPALSTKVSEMHRMGFTDTKEEDIWNYFKEVKWTSADNLNLYQMVSDILNTEAVLIYQYTLGNLSNKIEED